MKLSKSPKTGHHTLLPSDVHVCAVAQGRSCRGCAADGDIRRIIIIIIIQQRHAPPPPWGHFFVVSATKSSTHRILSLPVRARARFLSAESGPDRPCPEGSVWPRGRRCSQLCHYITGTLFI